MAADLLPFIDGDQCLSSLGSSHDISLVIFHQVEFCRRFNCLACPDIGCWSSGTVMMDSDVNHVSIDRLPLSRPVSQRLDREAIHSAGYIPGDRERRAPQSNLTLNPAQLELAPAVACRACMLVGIVSDPNQWPTRRSIPLLWHCSPPK